MANDQVQSITAATDVLRSALAPGRHDVALAELPHADRQRLDSAPLPWLTSLGFCTIYDFPPAQRALLHVDDSGCVTRAAFYRERSSLGIIRLIEFLGCPELSDAEILDLLSLRHVHVAVLYRLETPDQKSSSARVRPIVNHDVIAELPISKEEYLQSLGKQKRQQLPRYWRRLQRQYNDQIVMLYESGQRIELDEILQLVGFNQTRMSRQGKDNATAFESAQQRLWPLTQSEGLLCKMVGQGRLLGGTFNYVHRDEAFLIVIAHDPALEHLNIGNVSLWKTIEHLIDRGVRRYHLFWGRMRYKTEFGGVDHPVVLTIIARNSWLAKLWRAHLLLNRQIPRAARFMKRSAWKVLQRGATLSSERSPGYNPQG
ncbi:MAG: GNAT family N-acetyltransferase [Phycisphaerales bacterium]|nr:GNAT family N-acetyltransferase [Phycisphaerales bacterium]MCI0677394.1 GNAT family N-acetyltransferase [Phycisphaerales bacterium]